MDLKLRKQLNQKKRDHKINNEISAQSVRVIDTVEKTNEILPLWDALQKAKLAETDLVQISDGEIPIVKLVDYDKFIYQQDKAKKEKKQVVKKLKQVQFHPTIGPGDLEHKVKHITEFINDGHKVQCVLRFAGRQNQHRDIGYALFEKIKEQLESVAKLETPISSEGNSIKMLFTKK